jgi:glycosyltransferase involved in cell wall biosynthesis
VTDDSADPEPDRLLSVVIVTYNEAERIRGCIESVLAATRGLRDVEMVLVDSNSSDGTVDIAAEYPVTVLRIPDDDLTTPGAGRYVGTAATSGDRILFVDGDMVVGRPWLERALRTLDSRDDVAAVDGHLDAPGDEVTEVDAVRGVALYRRQALEETGGFDPFLKSLEDIHLGFELTAAGHTLVRLPEVAGEHTSRETLSEPFRRFRRGYSVGPGQALRRSVGSAELFGKHLSRIQYRLVLVAWLCVGLTALVFRRALLAWVGLSVAGGGLLVAQRGPKGALGFLLSKLFGIVGVVKGAARTPQPRESFPLDAVEQLHHGKIIPATTPADADAA